MGVDGRPHKNVVGYMDTGGQGEMHLEVPGRFQELI
jgi:hypothetical protein